MSGPLALVGGGEWNQGCSFDENLVKASGSSEVVVLAAAAAYEGPDRVVAKATEYFSQWDIPVVAPAVFQRRDALVTANAQVLRGARFIYIADGSPLHLRSVLKSTPLWEAIVEAWEDGAVVAGSGAGAMVIADPMVDPRGGAFTVGLGLITGIAVHPHADDRFAAAHHRTLALADAGLRVAAIPEQTALLRSPDGAWSVEGVGTVTVYVDTKARSLSVLP